MHRVVVAALVAALAFAGVAQAGSSPARPVPADYWQNAGTLQPVDPDPLPEARDTTFYNEFRRPVASSLDFWVSADVANNYLFMGLAHGFEIWDPSNDPANPTKVAETRFGAWPTWCNNNEFQFILQDADVADSDDTVVGIGGACAVGFAIANTTAKTGAPPIAYQHYGYDAFDVEGLRVGSTTYAFVASGQGVRAYDMSAAKQYVRCLESSGQCPNVNKGQLDTVSSETVNGADQFLAASRGVNGVKVWDVSSPTSPQVRIQASASDIGLTAVQAVEMWRTTGKYYLAVAGSQFVSGVGLRYQLRIYDVDCIKSGGCSLGSPLFSQSLSGITDPPILTASRSDGTAFLYVGTTNRNAPSPQKEWLFNVGTPSSASTVVDITPPARHFVNGKEIGYWGWYYDGNPTGFHYFRPRRGVFLGEYFYRAGHTIFDIHKRGGSATAPVADFDFASLESDGRIYPNSTVRFTDNSGGAPDGWDWSFEDGSPGFSDDQNPQVTFTSPGTKSVSLVVSRDDLESDPFLDTVTVLPPSPSLNGISVNLASAVQCQAISLEAIEPKGKPPLSYAWSVLNAQGAPVASEVIGSTSKTATWTPSLGLPTGAYRARVTVSNQATTDTAAINSPPITIILLPDLPAPGFPIDDPVVIDGTVDFHVDAPGATEWRWAFGDGTSSGWVSNPITGPSPTHVYAEEGEYPVRVEVRSCKGGPVASETINVVVDQVIGLHAEFAASGLQCAGGVCFAELNQAIQFNDFSTGAQLYEYDWDGNGTYEESSSTPVTSHSYGSAGTFHPNLKVSRRDGQDIDLYSHPAILVEGNSPPPPTPRVTVSGPSTGQVGTEYTFTASCTGAGASGWSWNTGGGTVTGSSNGNSIRLTWSSTGSKTVTASHAGCTAGSRNIAISGGGGGGGGTLTARYTYLPTRPGVGQTVNFNGSTSSGSPDGFFWEFGDGETASGAQASHAFTQAGTYRVKLTVSGPGNCPQTNNRCFDELTQTLTVGGGDPNPPPPPGGNDLEALFVFAPSTPGLGTAVAFDARTSKGSPITFLWDFGDGSTGTGSQVSHAFSQPGQYKVTLTVSKPGSGQGCFSGICFDDLEQTVAVSDLGPPPGPDPDTGPICDDDPDAFCLGGGRFRVTVSYKDQHNGGTEGIGRPALSPLTAGQDTTGFFYFFNSDSTDLIIKMIDGTTVNDHNWFFYGSLSDVEYTVRVEDQETNQVREYHNDPGDLCGESDTSAFRTPQDNLAIRIPVTDEARAFGGPVRDLPRMSGTCQSSADTLCLLDGRFAVTVDWHDQFNNGDGHGQAIPGTDGSGYFWFFNPTNVELVVKAIDATAVNDHFWLFFGALTKVEYTVTVTDTVTSTSRVYSNDPENEGTTQICGQADTEAFDG